jgi:tetratricopeptide (TPR) repeat protein
LVEREALSVVQFRLAEGLPKAQVLADIRADATIGEDVRERALMLAEPYWQNRVRHEAQALVGSLFYEPLLRPEVQERIRTNMSLREPVRQEALDLARDCPEGAGRFNDVSWGLVRRAETEAAEYRRALCLAEVACRLVPDNATYLTTLGVAQYRVGQYRQAVGTLTQAHKLIPVARQGSLPTAWVFLAMAHWQLAEKQEARQWYDSAVQWLDKNDPKNEELGRFRVEAEELLGVKDNKN